MLFSCYECADVNTSIIHIYPALTALPVVVNEATASHVDVVEPVADAAIAAAVADGYVTVAVGSYLLGKCEVDLVF